MSMLHRLRTTKRLKPYYRGERSPARPNGVLIGSNAPREVPDATQWEVATAIADYVLSQNISPGRGVGYVKERDEYVIIGQKREERAGVIRGVGQAYVGKAHDVVVPGFEVSARIMAFRLLNGGPAVDRLTNNVGGLSDEYLKMVAQMQSPRVS